MADIPRAYDDPCLAAVYDAGNDMPTESLQAWAELIASFSQVPAPAVLEIGAGTGMFCRALQQWGNTAIVIGIDRSWPMLEQARTIGVNESVHYVAGDAESVPIQDNTIDLALLSRVIHHLPDRLTCARELARVLKSAGTVVIRTTFRETLDAPVYEYWPELLDVDRRRFPRQADVIQEFEEAGFTSRCIVSFAQPVVGSVREYRARMSTRPQSKFKYLTTEQYECGLRRLERDVNYHEGPVLERYDVLVLDIGRRDT